MRRLDSRLPAWTLLRMRLLAPAKVNLHLRVGPRDGTGYHPLVTWMCTVGLFDRLDLHRRDESSITMSCDDPSLPCDSRNLVIRAATALGSGRGAHIELQKRIPIAAGLGGGSSDAARALLGLNSLWNLNLPLDRLHAIAAQLGSDVPFFLHGPSKVCSGRGEVVRETAAPKVRWALLILSDIALSTAQVYAAFDELRLGIVGFGDARHIEPPWQEWAELSARPLLARLVNDLEPAAFALSPRLAEWKARLEATLDRVIRMSGSGSTLFTLYDTRDDAENDAHIVRQQQPLSARVAELAPQIGDDLIERPISKDDDNHV